MASRPLSWEIAVSASPRPAADHDLLVRLMEGVEDIPGAALHEGLPWAWESFPEYLDFLGTRQFDMDIGTQLPHAALRVFVMGERGANREVATAQDIAAMRRITADAIRAGALGFSSSRTLNHRSSTGDPTPSLNAERAELVGIGMGLKDAGRGVLEMISDFKDAEDDFQHTSTRVLEAHTMPTSWLQGRCGGGEVLCAMVHVAPRTGEAERRPARMASAGSLGVAAISWAVATSRLAPRSHDEYAQCGMWELSSRYACRIAGVEKVQVLGNDSRPRQ